MDQAFYNIHLKDILSHRIGEDWRSIGRFLGINDGILDILDQDTEEKLQKKKTTEEKAYSMLTKWVQINHSPTTEELKTALQKIERNDLLRIVDEFSTSQKLKDYYLKSNRSISEPSHRLYAPAHCIDTLNNFVELCIVKETESHKKSYEPISYNEIIFTENPVILISGVAGIGKTWLLRKCLLDWSNDLIWKNYMFVFYLECRILNLYSNISDVNELLHVFYKDFVKDFNYNNHKVVFIIDGLDEFKYLNELVNPSSACNFPIVSVLAEIRKYKYIVSGRNYAIDQFQSISTDHGKLTIQIMGFNDNGISNYIDINIIDKYKEVVKMILKKDPMAKSMASVPFYLSSICKIIAESEQKNLSFLTDTDLFASKFFYFIQKHIEYNGLVNRMMEIENYNEFILNIFKIAYESYIKKKVIFSRNEVLFLFNDDKYLDEENLFGFIERIETCFGFYYQFSHLSLIKFCASVYAYNNFSGEEIMGNKKLKSCLSIICGLTNTSQKPFWKILLNNSNNDKLSMITIISDVRKSSNFTDHNLFIKCFYESQSSITDEIESFIDEQCWEVSIDYMKTSYDAACENYFINHLIKSGKKLLTLYLRKNILNYEEKYLIMKCSSIVKRVHFYIPINFEGWKPKEKIEMLWIDIERYLISKKDFEDCFLPWLFVSEGLYLQLNDDTDFIENLYEWIACSKLKMLWIRYRGKHFRNLQDLKQF